MKDQELSKIAQSITKLTISLVVLVTVFVLSGVLETRSRDQLIKKELSNSIIEEDTSTSVLEGLKLASYKGAMPGYVKQNLNQNLLGNKRGSLSVNADGDLTYYFKEDATVDVVRNEEYVFNIMTFEDHSIALKTRGVNDERYTSIIVDNTRKNGGFRSIYVSEKEISSMVSNGDIVLYSTNEGVYQFSLTESAEKGKVNPTLVTNKTKGVLIDMNDDYFIYSTISGLFKYSIKDSSMSNVKNYRPDVSTSSIYVNKDDTLFYLKHYGYFKGQMKLAYVDVEGNEILIAENLDTVNSYSIINDEELYFASGNSLYRYDIGAKSYSVVQEADEDILELYQFEDGYIVMITGSRIIKVDIGG